MAIQQCCCVTWPAADPVLNVLQVLLRSCCCQKKLSLVVLLLLLLLSGGDG
jgi:hypothetical protein